MTDLLGSLQAALAERYTVEREIGHGGMAVVFLAHDLKHDRQVAIKVLRPELAAALGAERFLREIAILAQLQHPHILRLYDSGAAGGFLYYVMPYVPGKTLRARLKRETQLSLEDALQLTREVADALSYAHHHGVVHRDIKPENILLESGHALVADFGIARAITVAGGEELTATGVVVGTPAYMSPEQASGEQRVDGRSDVYSLGCVLYEMLAGAPPFTGPTPQAIMAKHSLDPLPPLKTVRAVVPAAVERAITKAMGKVPADRFTTPAEFVAALVARVGKRDHHLWRLVIGTTAVLAVIGLGVSRLLSRHASTAQRLATTIAVLPLAPSVPDSSLSRVGRDLMFTISATLDGVGEIRTVDPHTVLVQAETRATPYSAEQAAALGRRLNAGRVLTGSLVRQGSDVRLDLELLGTAAATSMGRVTVVEAPDSMAALTDSATMRLLRQIWQRGEPPTPSLVAVTTRSVPALRAFLEGERDMAGGLWQDAEKAFATAIAADSNFWLAYWRHMYVMNFESQAEDPGLYRTLWQHRGQLRGVDSLLLAADQGPGRSQLSVALALGEEATRKFPENWWAWFFYADYLVHQGPRLGYSSRDAQSALERTLALNPSLPEAWAHLLMVTVGRDSAAARRAFTELHRVSQDPGRVRWERQFYELDRNGGVFDTALADSVERDAGGPTLLVPNLSTFFLAYGFPVAQIDYDRRMLRRGVPFLVAPILRISLARAWAARGAWDSALVAADDYAAKGEGDDPALEAYRIAVIGAWLGALDARTAQRRRRALAPSVEALVPIDKAETAWLDGMLAFALRDRSALVAARALLRQSGDSAWPVLDRSLAAFGVDLEGDWRRAADTLAAIEWQRPDFVPSTQGLAGVWTHPFLSGVNRMAAADWLLQEGDTAQAARLLTWHESRVFSLRAHSADATMAGLAYLKLARIEEARDRPELAREYYGQFLRRVDQPVPALRHDVEEARAALARLASKAGPARS